MIYRSGIIQHNHSLVVKRTDNETEILYYIEKGPHYEGLSKSS